MQLRANFTDLTNSSTPMSSFPYNVSTVKSVSVTLRLFMVIGHRDVPAFRPGGSFLAVLTVLSSSVTSGSVAVGFLDLVSSFVAMNPCVPKFLSSLACCTRLSSIILMDCNNFRRASP